VPESTTGLLRAACELRNIAFIDIDAPSFDFGADSQLPPGSALYRSGVSISAIRVEQFLTAPGVGTFYTDPDGLFFVPDANQMLFRKAGINTPRTVSIGSPDRDLLRSHVTRLGGFPVILKVLGYSLGLGTVRVDSFAALFSSIDYLLAKGECPLMASYIEDAIHWRLIVVGTEVVAGYRNTLREDDFRTSASEAPSDYFLDLPENLREMASKAVLTARLEFGGVDILEHPSGRLYLLEVNFPCYFGHAEEVAGINVAGRMVEHLVAKARSLSGIKS
jgi:RimK-like ATP-grasp domain